jgi:DNA-binding PadR family transcriptional regulator
MELTQRQETFLRDLLKVYHELKGPVHYAELAKYLGINRFTAYDMLKVLEEKGFAQSYYDSNGATPGPGRPKIVFEPTDRTRYFFAAVHGVLVGKDWETVKELFFDSLENSNGNSDGLAQEVLSRLPTDSNPTIQYCVEVMSVIVLRLHYQNGRKSIHKHLSHLLSPDSQTIDKTTLSLLSGFALGMLAQGEIQDEDWWQEVFDHTRQYQAIVINMTPRECNDLLVALKKVFNIFSP